MLIRTHLSRHGSSISSPLARSMSATVMPAGGAVTAPAAAPSRGSLPAVTLLGTAPLLTAVPHAASDSRCRSVSTASSTVPIDSAKLGTLLRVLEPWLLSDDRRRRCRAAAESRALPAMTLPHALQALPTEVNTGLTQSRCNNDDCTTKHS